MDEFYYEEDSNKHLFTKVLILIFVIGLILGVIFYYKTTHTIKLKNITLEVGSEVSKDINTYIKNGKNIISNYKLDVSKVNSNKVGKYSYKVKYNKHSVTGYINVVDTIAPDVEIDDSIIVGTEYDFNPNITILKCNDLSLPCTASISDSDYKKIKSIGEYDIKVTISDKYSNKVNKNVHIKVIDGNTINSTVTNDINYYSNSINDENLGHDLFIKFDNAILEDDDYYNEAFIELSSEDFSIYYDNIDSTKIITAYNKYGYVIGLQVQVTLNNGSKVLLQK